MAGASKLLDGRIVLELATDMGAKGAECDRGAVLLEDEHVRVPLGILEKDRHTDG